MTERKTTVKCRYCGRYLEGIGPCPYCTHDEIKKMELMWNKGKRKTNMKHEPLKIKKIPRKRKKRKYFYDTIEKENEDWHNNKNPLVRLFYRMKFGIAIDYANLKQDDLILDFGCGNSQLKKMLPNYNVIGYDIDPKLTEIKDYRKLKPDKIFAMDVFEHIPKREIRRIIRNFKKMNPNFVLVTAIPTETWLWRKARKLMGLSETVADHITPLKEILKILNEELKLEKWLNFVLMTHISTWKN